ncbi:uncharacterized protein LOC141528435 [Cotesia typhae]|uniref:uncharacterized protein LOC141528435 n=1 Tax=Cotesia typhae TaxID=2053667 RepID=UPI003D68B6E0
MTESLELTDENYQVAVSILKDRYESTRRLTRRHWSVLREYPCLQKDSPAAISHLVDTFNQHTRALENLKAPVCFWDIPLVDLILTKISPTTAWHWELTLSDDKIPSFKDLLKFLEKRAVCGDNVRNDTNLSNSKATHHRPQSQAFYSNNVKEHTPSHQYETSVTCPVCDENHRLFTCDKFRELRVEDRRKAVSNAQLCFNCFGKNHAVKSCHSKGTCRKCSKRHNTLLYLEITDNSSVTPRSESSNNNNNSRT